ncbi:MAG: peptide/nickel transport system substrate-binding protein [Nocardioidaceae bacterium]|jgi:peptide/nickel transport system substrate-binding protein|nr:peptide/nickel transport system substrate-binding protein [Nocardioidaceae bacterium]
MTASDNSEAAGGQGSWLGSPVSRRQLFAGAAGAAAVAGLSACSGTTPSSQSGTSSSSSAAAGKPKRGGNFRLGVTGGGTKDIFDGQNIITKPDQARLVSAFETLLTFDDQYNLTKDGLATNVVADTPTQYTIELRKGIEFHNGKTMTADDVIYSLQRIGTKANGLTGYAATASMDIANIKKVDQYTVRLPLKTADSTVPQTLASYTFGIVPVGYKAFPSKQIGTGAYKLKSFTPGQQSVSERNPNYWRTGQPYFDTVTITDFADATAQVNALLGGQIDAMTDVTSSQVQTLKAQQMEVLISNTGGWVPLCMAIDMPPFDDVRVRQAMRLIIDREAMLKQIASGYGRVANDLYAPFDEGYDSSLPQRTRDIAQAKSLLKAAGKEGLTVDLHTTNGAQGMVSLATVFASQAKDAGVTINVKNDPNYYGSSYLKLPFSVDFWGTRGYLNQVQQGSLPNAPYNETHWPPKSGKGSNFDSLYSQALAATDSSKRIDIEHQMQKLEYDMGGYIIPFFGSLIDGHSPKVKGFTPSKGTLNLTSFGHGYRTIWFA